MEAKLALQRRANVRCRLPAIRHSINFPAVRGCLQTRIRAVCSTLLNFLKTRDPLFNLLVLPKERDGEKEKEETRIFIAGRFAAVIPGNSTAEYVIANGFLNFLNLYNFALVGRLILTWFPSRPPALERPLSTVCDPYLNLFRGIIPPVGGIDFSPILAFVVLNVFTNAAAAIPAEIPRHSENKRQH